MSSDEFREALWPRQMPYANLFYEKCPLTNCSVTYIEEEGKEKGIIMSGDE